MEYVTYLSKNKIDMLYEQLNESRRNFIVEGKLNLGWFSSLFSKKIVTSQNYYEKLEKVISNINNVGTVFDKKADFIAGTMNMTWGVLRYTSEATFWIGEDFSNNCLSQVLLIGSSNNIVGNSPKVEGVHYSPLVYFLEAYAKELELQNHKKKLAKKYHECEVVSIVENIKSYCEFKEENLSSDYKFLAKPLACMFYDSDTDIKRNYIIASPIYVSLR